MKRMSDRGGLWGTVPVEISTSMNARQGKLAQTECIQWDQIDEVLTFEKKLILTQKELKKAGNDSHWLADRAS